MFQVILPRTGEIMEIEEQFPMHQLTAGRGAGGV